MHKSPRQLRRTALGECLLLWAVAATLFGGVAVCHGEDVTFVDTLQMQNGIVAHVFISR